MLLSGNLIIWQQALGLIISLIILVFIFWLYRRFREFVWKRSSYSEGRLTTYLSKNWGVFIILAVLAVFGYIIITIISLFGEDKFTESIVVASALTVFIFFQLPRLLKPHIHVTLLYPDKEGLNTQLRDLKVPLNCIELHPETRHVLYVYITNLGINIYENWGVFITFNKAIRIYGHQSSTLISYRHQERNNTVVCEPSTSMPFGPDDNLILNTIIDTPDIVGRFPVKVTFKCSTRWGETEREVYLYIRESNI